MCKKKAMHSAAAATGGGVVDSGHPDQRDLSTIKSSSFINSDLIVLFTNATDLSDDEAFDLLFAKIFAERNSEKTDKILWYRSEPPSRLPHLLRPSISQLSSIEFRYYYKRLIDTVTGFCINASAISTDYNLLVFEFESNNTLDAQSYAAAFALLCDFINFRRQIKQQENCEASCFQISIFLRCGSDEDLCMIASLYTSNLFVIEKSGNTIPLL